MSTVKIFIITGFRQKKNNIQFKWMKPFFSKLGHEVEIFAPHWNNRVMSDWLVEFKEYYESNKAERN